MEEKIDLDSFSKSIESLKEVSIRSKDYIKFVIGLSTGTLILSTTLAKDFFKTPQYNFILIIGWALLFISIVVGVWILPVWDNIQGWFELMKKIFGNPEEAKWLLMGKLGEHRIIEWMKQATPDKLMEDEKIQDFFKKWENYVSTKNLKPKQLKKLKELTESVGTAGVKDEFKQMMKDTVAEMFSFYSFFKYYEKITYLPGVLKKIRWIFWQMRYLEKVMRYSFFVGMLAILVFAIINFIK